MLNPGRKRAVIYHSEYLVKKNLLLEHRWLSEHYQLVASISFQIVKSCIT